MKRQSWHYLFASATGSIRHQGTSIPWLAWTKTTRCCEINTCRRINLFVALLAGISWSCRPSKASGCPDENWPAGVPSRRSAPSSRSAQRQTRHFLPRYATTRITCCLTFCLRRKSRCTSCDLKIECMTEFFRRQTTGCVELFLLACYILITRVYEVSCMYVPCVYCITISATQNAVCNCEIKSILTYFLSYLLTNITLHAWPICNYVCMRLYYECSLGNVCITRNSAIRFLNIHLI